MVSLGQIRSWNTQFFLHCEMFAAFRDLLAEENDVGLGVDEMIFDRQFEVTWLDRAFVVELTFSTPDFFRNTKTRSTSVVTCYELKSRGKNESIDGETRAVKLGSCELLINGLQRGFIFSLDRSRWSFCPSQFTDALWIVLTLAGFELETTSFKLTSEPIKVRPTGREIAAEQRRLARSAASQIEKAG